jgi:hypothetical protein
MPSRIRLVDDPLSRQELLTTAQAMCGPFVKAVVDVQRRVLVIGGELQSDEEAYLIDRGSRQHDLWGINLYPANVGDGFLEFDSMINVRPASGNRSRAVDDPAIQRQIRDIVAALVIG